MMLKYIKSNYSKNFTFKVECIAVLKTQHFLIYFMFRSLKSIKDYLLG